jgi:hypothetical protein
MTISMRRAGLTAGGVLLLGLAGIGLVQAASSARGGPAAPGGDVLLAAAPATTTDSAATGGSDASIASEIDAILAADQTAAGPSAAQTDAAGVLRRLRVGRRLVHGSIVVDLPKTGLTTIQVDHGTISTVGATSLTIAEKGSTTATVSLGKDTRVRRNGAKAVVGDLKTGDAVFVMSKVGSGGTVAYLVIVPKP